MPPWPSMLSRGRCHSWRGGLAAKGISAAVPAIAAGPGPSRSADRDFGPWWRGRWRHTGAGYAVAGTACKGWSRAR